MKFIWKGKWKRGEVTIEADNFQELDDALKLLQTEGSVEESSEMNSTVPEISSERGCVATIRTILKADWGKQPRSMNEIKKVLDSNALYFSKGTLSGALARMTKQRELRRVKEEGRWKYAAKSM
jgi:hypothetical protein